MLIEFLQPLLDFIGFGSITEPMLVIIILILFFKL